MIQLLRLSSSLLAWSYSFVFFCLLKTILPLRGKTSRGKGIMSIAGYICVCFVADAIIYSNDLDSLLGTLLGFMVYILVFHRGKLLEKISVLLVFYPALVAVNYLMWDIGRRMFFGIKNTVGERGLTPGELTLISEAIHTASLLLRLLFWIGAWFVLRRFLGKIASRLSSRMWLIVDMLITASFVAIFTIIYFMPGDTAIVYPICGAAIFSSFGCMYLASYICESMQAMYRVQELEMQQNYFRDRFRDEERVRSIYHDLKNHLLIWQSEAGSGHIAQSVKTLQSQIEGYENYQHTGNEILDIIIRDKARLAQEKMIDFSAVISFQDGAFLDALDISTIFGNALDNAIEASERLPKEERLVTVKADRIRDMLVILVENRADTEIPPSGKTAKKDPFFHGFGLPNIRKAAERYGGQCSTKAENGMFALKIMIPIPN